MRGHLDEPFITWSVHIHISLYDRRRQTYKSVGTIDIDVSHASFPFAFHWANIYLLSSFLFPKLVRYTLDNATSYSQFNYLDLPISTLSMMPYKVTLRMETKPKSKLRKEFVVKEKKTSRYIIINIHARILWLQTFPMAWLSINLMFLNTHKDCLAVGYGNTAGMRVRITAGSMCFDKIKFRFPSIHVESV